MNRTVLVICATEEMEPWREALRARGGDFRYVEFLVGLMRPGHVEDLADAMPSIEETVQLVRPGLVLVDPYGDTCFKPPRGVTVPPGFVSAHQGPMLDPHDEALREPLSRLCLMFDRLTRETGCAVAV